jgi:hypothetical protein
MDDLITIAGDSANRLAERFHRWDGQYGDAGAKFMRLEKFRARIARDPLDWPLRPKPAKRSKACEDAIIALMRADPQGWWSVSELVRSKAARKLKISTKTMVHLTTTLRGRGILEWADVGRHLLRLKSDGLPVQQSRSTQMVEQLYATPDHKMELYALKEAVRAPTVTVVTTLRNNGVVKCPDLRRGTVVELTADALAKIKRSQPIRDGRGAILWEPPNHGRLDLPPQWMRLLTTNR